MELRERRRDTQYNGSSHRSSQRDTGEGSSNRISREGRSNERAISSSKTQVDFLSPDQASRKPSLRSGHQSMLMAWSKKANAVKTAAESPEDRIREALETEISPRDITERLSLKRQILGNISTSPTLRMTHRTHSKLGVFALAKYQVASAMDKLKRAIAEISPELWKSSIKSIEGQFGSGVGSYFRLLRLLLQVNIIIVIVSFCFLIFPQVFLKNGEDDAANVTEFKAEDLFTFDGWMAEKMYLFYGNYKNGTIDSQFWNKYDMEPGYFYTIFCCFILYLLVVLVTFLQSYKAKLKNGGQTTGKTYSKCVFTRWEMNVTDEQAAKSLRAKITDDFIELLKKTERRRKLQVPIETKVIRGLLLMASLVIIGGILTGIVYLIQFESNESSSWLDKVAVSLVMAATFFVIPGVFDFFGRIENYDHQVKLYLGLSRMVLLTMGPVVIIVYMRYPYMSNRIGSCPQTIFGQEIYKLLLWSYLIGVIMINTITETIRNIIFRMGFKFIGAPEFDTGRNTMFLIYGQVLAWVGLYFSPMLPLCTVVLLLLCFYIKRLSLHYNCSLSPKTWEGATSKTVFYALTLFLFLMSFVFFLWIITEQHSASCGPFRGMKPYDQPPLSDIMTLISSQLIGFLDLILAVLGFYCFSLANARRKRGKELRKQKKIEREDLRFLRQELLVFYQNDGKLRM